MLRIEVYCFCVNSVTRMKVESLAHQVEAGNLVGIDLDYSRQTSHSST